MNAILEAQSTLTESYQTTVPQSIRQALGLAPGDKMRYAVLSDGRVLLTRAAAADAQNPARGPQLHSLAPEQARAPERLQPIDLEVRQRILSLVGDIELDLGAPRAARRA